jgi:hypothetical protein
MIDAHKLQKIRNGFFNAEDAKNTIFPIESRTGEEGIL